MVIKKSSKYVVRKFQGCVDRISGVLLRVFEGSERGVSMEFLEGFKEVPGHFKVVRVFLQKFQASVIESLKVFQKSAEALSFKGAEGKCRGRLKSVSWMIQESFKRPFEQVSRGVSGGFQGSYIKVSRVCLKEVSRFLPSSVPVKFN